MQASKTSLKGMGRPLPIDSLSKPAKAEKTELKGDEEVTRNLLQVRFYATKRAGQV